MEITTNDKDLNGIELDISNGAHVFLSNGTNEFDFFIKWSELNTEAEAKLTGIAQEIDAFMKDMKTRTAEILKDC